VLGVEIRAPVRVCNGTWQKRIRAQGAGANAIKVLTIAFGDDTDKTVLEAIANYIFVHRLLMEHFAEMDV
jgi:hypothetical protein